MRLASDAAPWLPPKPKPIQRLRMRRRSLHLTMRDGVRLALDVHLPLEGTRFPAIVRQTRYFRGIDFREPWRRLPFDWLFDHAAHTRRRFVKNGYAWIDVCARGSGASFGSRPCPWSPDEVADGAEIVGWIVSQPWSAGLIGTTGVSYDGTAADFLLSQCHPAVRASAPRFSLFDVFPDVAFPGGIHLTWFTEQWSRFNRDLDDNRLDRAFSRMLGIQIDALGPGHALSALGLPAGKLAAEWLLRRIATGVLPVDSDADRSLLARAIEQHRDNFDVHRGALAITYRDDVGVSPTHPDESIDLFSPHRYADALERSGAAVLSISGWLDGGYPQSSIQRFQRVQNAGSRLLLGPWDHGGLHDISPFSESPQSAFDQDGELLRFFDRHLRNRDDAEQDPPVRYFTIGEERWKSADSWPPPHVRYCKYHLGESGTLAPEPGPPGVDEHTIDREVGTGRRSRWVSLLGLLPAAGYADRAPIGRRLLVYRSAPLRDPVEVTGQPVVVLRAAFDGDDASVFAYLEAEAPDGSARYVTEGQLRALHRRHAPGRALGELPVRSFLREHASPLARGDVAELVFALQPISWQFSRGYRIRLALAGADADHFARIDGARTWAVRRGADQGSWIELPIAD